DLYVRTAFRLLLIGLPIAGLAALLGPHAFAFVFSAEWTEAGVYARLLAPLFLVQFVASPLSQTLNVLERQDVQFVWDAFRLVLVGGALLVANASGWSATHAIAAVSIALGLAYVVLIVVCWRLTSASRRRPACGPRPRRARGAARSPAGRRSAFAEAEDGTVATDSSSSERWLGRSCGISSWRVFSSYCAWRSRARRRSVSSPARTSSWRSASTPRRPATASTLTPPRKRRTTPWRTPSWPRPRPGGTPSRATRRPSSGPSARPRGWSRTATATGTASWAGGCRSRGTRSATARPTR